MSSLFTAIYTCLYLRDVHDGLRGILYICFFNDTATTEIYPYWHTLSLRALFRSRKNSMHCSGVALHSGAKVNMVLHPAEADTGIVFRRTDAVGGVEVQALWCNAIEIQLCTTLVNAKGK